MSIVENFLRRWSTLEITSDNALLFEEHLIGVRILCEPEEQKHLAGLTNSSTRSEFARRYNTLTATYPAS